MHCIDAEGPLHESLAATFERLETILGVALPPSRATLEAIRRGEIDLRGQEETAKLVVSEPLLAYNDTWDKIDAMLDEMLSAPYRARYADGAGSGWVYNWFAMDHVGYAVNPRRRDVGYHNVSDHYRERMRAEGSERDELHWHFHPASTYAEAHVNATNYLRSPHLLESLCRRLIDRGDFPACFRPGFHVERPDSHWFLEQWIPFDYANQAVPGGTDEAQRDLALGRFGDWRRAPNDWSPYHPAHDDYQVPGDCRRVIFRCLNVGTRLRLLDGREVERAFARAASGLPTILAFTNHDFRDMRPDVAAVHGAVLAAAARHPDVQWRHAGAREAAREVLGLRADDSFRLETRVESSGSGLRLHVSTSADTFGPQPFLAIRTRDGRYLWDNLDVQVPRREWTYVFDPQSVPMSAVDQVGIASNDTTGATCVMRLDAELQTTRVHTAT